MDTQFMNEVDAKARQIQELIPEVLSIRELATWIGAMLRTTAELAQCGEFEDETIVGGLETYLEVARQLFREKQEIH